jgi:WD40-like Beta Propeller Repeat
MNERLSVRRLSLAGTLAVAASIALLAAAAASAMHFTAWAPLQAVEPTGTNLVNTAAHDGCPIESPDGLSLYIASNRTGGMGGLDIWVLTRSSTDADWGSPQNLGAPINTGADEFCPTPVRGNGLFFVSRKAGGCGLGDIYFTRRNPVHGWREPQHLDCAPAGPNSDLDEQGPSYVEDDGEALLYFSRSRAPNQGGAGVPGVPGDIFVSESGGGGFGPASLVPELSLAGSVNDIQPNVRKDGREVVFSSNRAGGEGSQDIWASTRSSIADAWSAPVNLGSNVNSIDSETRPSLSWDAKTLYVGITPPAGPPGDVYVSTRARK